MQSGFPFPSVSISRNTAAATSNSLLGIIFACNAIGHNSTVQVSFCNTTLSGSKLFAFSGQLPCNMSFQPCQYCSMLVMPQLQQISTHLLLGSCQQQLSQLGMPSLLVSGCQCSNHTNWQLFSLHDKGINLYNLLLFNQCICLHQQCHKCMYLGTFGEDCQGSHQCKMSKQMQLSNGSYV